MPKLTKEEILNRTDKGLEVFRHFLPGNWRLERTFLNPLYDDTHPSCNIYYNAKAGCFKMKDFGNDDYSGDCFFIVGKIFGLDCRDRKEFMQILKIINDDLHLCLDHGQPEILHTPLRTMKPIQSDFIIRPKVEPSRPSFNFDIQPFSAQELAYWKQYGIDETTLNNFHVVSIKEYSSFNKSGRPFTLRSSPQMPIYGYIRTNSVKIYRPKATSMRFLYGGNSGDFYHFGVEQLPLQTDSLLITGGEKDVMSLSARSFPAICFGSETCHIPRSFLEELIQQKGIDNIYLLFDMDQEGIKSSKRHIEMLTGLNINRVELPLSGTKSEKDISDFFRLGHSSQELSRLLIQERPQITKPVQIKMR